MSTPILFSPQNVKEVLANLPTLAGLIPDPSVEGVDSEAFPGVLRKTERELYRWIANTHYPHLAEVVPILERTLAVGCRFGHLLDTRERERFTAHSAEMLVADDLMRRGYTVTTVETGNDVTPDLYVTGHGIDVAVEVYSPRELIAVDEWVREVSDLMSYADVAANFRSSVETKLLSTISQPQVPPEPWAANDMLAETRADVIAWIVEDVEASLRALTPLDHTYQHTPTRLVTTVELSDVHPAPEAGAARQGTVSYPGFSGYSPAGVFRRVVQKSRRKAKKKQTHGVAAAARVLVVYLQGNPIADDLNHPWHREAAAAHLEAIEPLDYGLDAIAFVARIVGAPGLARVFTVVDDTNITVEAVEAMFHREPEDEPPVT